MVGLWDLERKDIHLSNVFKEHGYETVLCGLEHEMQDFRSAGFEKSIHGTGEKGNGWKELAGVGKDIADWFSCRDKDRPFYLQIGCNETHRD